MQASLRLYLNIYMCLHVIALVTIFILPRLISTKGEKEFVSTKNYKKYSNKGDNSNSKIHTDDKELNFTNSNLPHQEPNNSMNGKLLDFINDINFKYECNTDANNSIPFPLKPLSDNYSPHATNEASILNNKIEDLFDKTFTGIVELKDDLMRMNENNEIFINSDGFRNRNNIEKTKCHPSQIRNNTDSNVEFLIKDKDGLNTSVQQTNVLPAVLSNGHTKYY